MLQTLTQFMVDEESKGNRLDKFLVGKLSAVSRVKIQKEIEKGTWRVDGKRMSPHYALKAGQKIEEVKDNNETRRDVLVSVKALEGKQGDKRNVGMEQDSFALQIIAETKDYVVVDKPAGIAVHPASGSTEPTLIEYLIRQYPELKKVGEDPLRPGVVHRIDKLVSGVWVCARNQEAYEHLKRQFKLRAVKKQYTALVYGTFINNEGIIDLSLSRSTAKGKRGTMKAVPRGALLPTEAWVAITRFEVVRRYPRFTLVHVFPETGRTHQIRAHFTGIGHPIVGDPLYHGRTKQKLPWTLTRPFLHASRIAFVDGEGETQMYESSLPVELTEVLKILK